MKLIAKVVVVLLLVIPCAIGKPTGQEIKDDATDRVKRSPQFFCPPPPPPPHHPRFWPPPPPPPPPQYWPPPPPPPQPVVYYQLRTEQVQQIPERLESQGSGNCVSCASGRVQAESAAVSNANTDSGSAVAVAVARATAQQG